MNLSFYTVLSGRKIILEFKSTLRVNASWSNELEIDYSKPLNTWQEIVLENLLVPNLNAGIDGKRNFNSELDLKNYLIDNAWSRVIKRDDFEVFVKANFDDSKSVAIWDDKNVN